MNTSESVDIANTIDHKSTDLKYKRLYIYIYNTHKELKSTELDHTN